MPLPPTSCSPSHLLPLFPCPSLFPYIYHFPAPSIPHPSPPLFSPLLSPPLFLSQDKPDQGDLRLGDTVAPLYVDQSRDALQSDKSVFEEITGGAEEIALGECHRGTAMPHHLSSPLNLYHTSAFPSLPVSSPPLPAPCWPSARLLSPLPPPPLVSSPPYHLLVPP